MGSRQIAAGQVVADRLSATRTELLQARQEVELAKAALERANLEAQAAAVGRQEAVDQMEGIRHELERAHGGSRQIATRR